MFGISKGEIMAEAKNGDTVKVHYTGTLEDGSKFDSSAGRDPLEFTIGEGKLLKPFESAVMGLSPGESIRVNIPAEEAYGQRRDELVGQVSRDQLPDDLSPEVGMQLQLQPPQGQPVVMTVIEMDDERITLDGNHQLAGQDLNFDIELVEIL
jgi:peptidylprolyl isomerase